MKCVLCLKKKGRRICKVNDTRAICSQCCGDARCDQCEGCGYFDASTAYARDKAIRTKTFITEIIPEVDDQCETALAHIEAGRISEGQKILEALAEKHPDYHTVLHGLGSCYGQQERIDESIAFLKRAIEVFPPFAHAHHNLGTSYLQNLDIARAVSAFRNAIEVDGEHGRVGQRARERLNELAQRAMQNHGVTLSEYVDMQRLFDKAFAALKKREFQTAIHLFQRVLATDKDSVSAHGNMGLAYAGLGDKEKALECLDKAIELDPSYEPALLNREAVALLEDGEALPCEINPAEVHYYRDYTMKGQSRIAELLQNADGQASMKKGQDPSPGRLFS